jgi:hypothetical protein
VEWDGKAQLRITPWPDRPVSLPLAVRRPTELDSTISVLVPFLPSGVPPADDPEAVELSGETYLELEQVDLDDPASILGFVRRYGPLGGWAAYHDLREVALNREDDVVFFLYFDEALNAEAIWEQKRRAAREQLFDLPPWIPEAERRAYRDRTVDELVQAFPPAVETLEEFRFAARLLRDLKTAWLVVREGRPPDSVEWLSGWRPLPRLSAEQRAELENPSFTISSGEIAADASKGELLEHLLRSSSPKLGDTRAAAVSDSVIIDPARFLTDMLERLLRVFSPKLGLEVHYFPPTFDPQILFKPPTEVVVMPRREVERIPLYAVLALELFNHILDNAEYRTCANERCRRTFVHQRGRAEKGQRRSSGVMYCTPECARATAQREYRRRKRARPGS